jgi:hypothetical protein
MKVHLRLAVAVLTILLFALTTHAENLSVDCRPNGKGIKTISEAVALIAKKNPLGPNTVTVIGQCVENVSIVSLDNLTLQASRAGASISDASNGTLDTLSVADSTRFALNGFTINGSVNCTDYSVCRLYGNTIQNSQIGWGLRGSRSQIDSQSDSISNNPGGHGVIVANQSTVVLFGDTVSQNGGAGVVVNNAGFLVLDNSNSPTVVSHNAGHGVFSYGHGTVRLQVANITGNGGDGIRVQDGSVLRAEYVVPTVNNITGNGGAGVNLGDLSDAFFAKGGSIIISGNLGGTDVYCAGQFAATRNVATVGGTTNCKEPNPE